MDWGTALIVVLFGCAGGLVSELVSGLVRPWKRRTVDRVKIIHKDKENVISKEKEFIGYDPGTLGTVLIGAAAAFAFWAMKLGTSETPQIYGTAFITGFGGSKILSDILASRFLNRERNSAVSDRNQLAHVMAEQIPEEGSDQAEPQTTGNREDVVDAEFTEA